jgi:hypothetical protein
MTIRTNKENEPAEREIQEIRDALESFTAAVEAAQVIGFKAYSMRAHDG